METDLTKPRLPSWTTLPRGIRNSNTCLELRAKYGGDAVLSLEQLFEEADPNGVYELKLFGIAHRSGGIDPKIIQNTVDHIEKEGLLILFSVDGHDMAINTKHHRYHPRGQSPSRPFAAKVPIAIRKRVEQICPEASGLWWPQGLETQARKSDSKRSKSAPQGQQTEGNAPLRGAKTPESRPLGAQKQGKGAPEGRKNSKNAPLGGNKTRLDKTRLDKIKESSVRTTSAKPENLDATAPKAVASELKNPTHISEIKDGCETAPQLLADLLNLFEKYDHGVVRLYVAMGLTPQSRRLFKDGDELRDTGRMRRILSELIAIRKGLPMTYKHQSVPIPTYRRLVEIMFWAAQESKATFENNNFLKSRIQLDIGKSIPESFYRDQPEETAQQHPPDNRITEAQCQLIQARAEASNIPLRRINAQAQKYSNAEHYLGLSADEADELIHWLNQLPAMSRDDVVEYLGGDEALARPLEEYCYEEDLLKRLGLAEWVQTGLWDRGRLQYNLQQLTLAEALSLTEADRKPLSRAASAVQWRKSRERDRSPPAGEP